MTSVRYDTAPVHRRHPISARVVQFPIVCFTLTLFTDLAYWRTANLMWQNFSSWLLFAGLITGVLAIVAGLLDLLFGETAGPRRSIWPTVIGGLIVLVLAFLNSLIHAGDGWTAVVPWGLTLSVATVVVIIATDAFDTTSRGRTAKRGDDHA
ncbi:DUF2231 domain-containing protein [Amorphus sp. 3PC139-8]|uniref:DUF2231 domain-containing protein n=1 Tax=Amorphus sp. 3PC139-8 TaxID=2735676 RepID=UPI00345D44FD